MHHQCSSHNWCKILCACNHMICVGHMNSPRCTVIKRMSQGCARNVWKVCRNSLHKLSILSNTPKAAFWLWMSDIAAATPHLVFVADAPSKALAMELLEGEMLTPLNCQNTPQFVCPEVCGSLMPHEYLQHLLRKSALACNIEPHRLWPLSGGILRLAAP